MKETKEGRLRDIDDSRFVVTVTLAELVAVGVPKDLIGDVSASTHGYSMMTAEVSATYMPLNMALADGGVGDVLIIRLFTHSIAVGSDELPEMPRVLAGLQDIAKMRVLDTVLDVHDQTISFYARNEQDAPFLAAFGFIFGCEMESADLIAMSPRIWQIRTPNNPTKYATSEALWEAFDVARSIESDRKREVKAP